MTEIAARAGRYLRRSPLWPGLRAEWKLAALAVIAALLVAVPELRGPAAVAVSDAYLSVSVFVALTLAIFYGAEHWSKADLGTLLMRHRAWQVPIGALLGATPGCGAEILLVTQYTRGTVSFGAIVATLTATMGDSAFLLIAKDPPAAAIVIGLCTVAGVVMGFLIDRLHPDGLGMLKGEIARLCAPGRAPAAEERPGIVTRLSEGLWLALIVPGAVLGILDAVQVDVNAWFGAAAEAEPVTWFGFVGGLLCLAMFLGRRGRNSHAGVDPRTTMGLPPVRRLVVDTNFVTAWVFVGLFGYEIVALATGGGVASWLQGAQIALPLVATLIGLIPGCGVMILVTTLYLQHQIPLAALVSAAISTDGDALFPAIALAPRAALLATLYTAAPALVMGYGWYLLMG